MYETWCANCEKSEVLKDSDGRKVETKLHKYIGETARSTHERGLEHWADAMSLNPKSHILKHYAEHHMGEKIEEVRFNMKVLKFAKTAFERQIYESVQIQESRDHVLLNSKSEYNRCSIPRITIKMGEKELLQDTKKREEELRQEEIVMERIRAMRKKRNRERGNYRGNPVRKKMRMSEENEIVLLNVIEETKKMPIPPCEKRKFHKEKEEKSRKTKQLKLEQFMVKKIPDCLNKSENECEAVPNCEEATSDCENENEVNRNGPYWNLNNMAGAIPDCVNDMAKTAPDCESAKVLHEVPPDYNEVIPNLESEIAMTNYENVPECCNMDGPIPDCEVHNVIPDQCESTMAEVIPDCETNKIAPYCCEEGQGYECDCCAGAGAPSEEREQGVVEVHGQDQVGGCLLDEGVNTNVVSEMDRVIPDKCESAMVMTIPDYEKNKTVPNCVEHAHGCACCEGAPGDEREQGLGEVHEQDRVGGCVPDGGVSADNCEHAHGCSCCECAPGDKREQGLGEVHEQDQVGGCVPDDGVSAENCQVRQNVEFLFNNEADAEEDNPTRVSEDDSLEYRSLENRSLENEESLVVVESCDQTIVKKELSTEDRKPQSVETEVKSNISTKPKKKSQIEKRLEKTSAALKLKKINTFFKKTSNGEIKADIPNTDGQGSDQIEGVTNRGIQPAYQTAICDDQPGMSLERGPRCHDTSEGIQPWDWTGGNTGKMQEELGLDVVD